MQQNKTAFFVIIGLAIAAVIGMVLAQPLLAGLLNSSVGLQQTSISVVTAPSIQPWVDQAAKEFNRTNSNIQVQIVTAKALIPETQFIGNSPESLPAAWLAEDTFVLGMNTNLQFGDSRSVASTALNWGAFNNRQQELTQKYGQLNWEALHKAAIEPNSSLKVLIASPQHNGEGLAALAAAVAGHLNKQTLSGADVNSAEVWLTETFKESARGSLTLSKPAEALFTRGASVGDVGVLTQASWRSAGLSSRPDFAITPMQPVVALDYPFAIRTDSALSTKQRAAAVAFRDFLLSQTQQNALANFYFDRAGANPNRVQVDGAAALALQRWIERELR
jgi:hypothetical protein